MGSGYEEKPISEFSTEVLKAEKDRLGELEIIDLTGLRIEEVSRALGEEVRTQVRAITTEKLKELDNPTELQNALNFSASCLNVLENKHSSDPLIENALRAYTSSLREWANAVNFSSIEHPLIKQLVESGRYDNDRFNLVYALMLQNDNVGCQSGFIKGSIGEVVSWHTEEDVEDTPGERFDKLRLLKFGSKDDPRYSFIYPDLLPGAAFNFGKNFFYSGDSQHTTEDQEPNILANTAAWVITLIGNERDPYDVIKELLPYADGYCLNCIRRTKDGIEAKKIEFAIDTVEQMFLDEKTGNYLQSTNLFSRAGQVAASGNETADEDAIDWNLKRQGIGHRALHLTKLISGKETIDQSYMQRLMTLRIGGVLDMAYSNKDVKASVVVVMDQDHMKLLISSGPALKDDKWTEIDL